MKISAVIFAGMAALFAAGKANACTLAPPPHWPTILSEGGPAVAVVRVVKIERAEQPSVTEYFETWDYTATVRSIDTIQGTPEPEYEVSGVGEVKVLKDGVMFCADQMNLSVGDVEFGVERPDGTFFIVEPHSIPSQFTSRIEAFK